MISLLLAMLLLGGAGVGAGAHYVQKNKQTGEPIAKMVEKDIKGIPAEIKNLPNELKENASKARRAATELSARLRNPDDRKKLMDDVEAKILPYLNRVADLLDAAKDKLQLADKINAAQQHLRKR